MYTKDEIIITTKKMLVIASVYVVQQLPFSLLVGTIPVLLRQQGVSLQFIGMLSFLGLPALMKFAWAPIIDRYGWRKFGHYKSWIIGIQIIILWICLNFMIIYSVDYSLFLILGGLIAFLSATTDIATDGLTVLLLESEERPLGSTMRMMGISISNLLAGSVLLILIDKFGWSISVLCFLGIYVLFSIPVILTNEPVDIKNIKSKVNWISMTTFFQEQGMVKWAFILICYTVDFTLALSMFRPMLVDIGFSLETIGLMNGTAGVAGNIIGGFIGSYLTNIIGRKKALFNFTLLQSFSILLHIFILIVQPSFLHVFVINFTFWVSIGMTSAVAGAAILDRARLNSAASDISLQTSLMFLGRIPAGALSGMIAGSFGYGAVFAVGSLVSLGLAGLIWKFYEEPINQK